MFAILSRYEAKRAMSISLAVTLAFVAGHYIDAEQSFWAGISALLVSQTSRGTPARQSFHMLFLILVFALAGLWLQTFTFSRFDLILISAGLFVLCAGFVMMRQPENFRVTLMWLAPAMVFLIAVLWPQSASGKMMDSLMPILAGGVIGMFGSLLVFPVAPYREFSNGLLPIINAMAGYAHELHNDLLDQKDHQASLEKRIQHIETIMLSQQNQYPEWVFENGFNRNLRAGFRYVLVQLEYITESVISLDYHLRQPLDKDLLADVSKELAEVAEKNAHLLQVLREYFASGQFEDKHENFTHDITSLQNAMHAVLPGSVDLLDMSQDYVTLSAIARNLIDMRELLVRLIAGLPQAD